MRVIFMGTSPFGEPALKTMVAGPHDVVAVYTQPPRPAGRGHQLQKTAIHLAADQLNLPVCHPASLKVQRVVDELKAFDADLLVVAAYGLLLPPAVLTATPLGAINLHASILPRWRGAAPIQRAIMAGDSETGVAIFQMEEGLDTGPVYVTKTLPITSNTTASALHDDLAAIAAALMPDVLDGLAAGTLQAIPQPSDGAIYAHKITKADGRLNFTEPAALIERRLRALTPWPGCFCFFEGDRLILEAAQLVPLAKRNAVPGEIVELPLNIACGEGALQVTQAKRAGKRSMSADELQRGLAMPVGTILTV